MINTVDHNITIELGATISLAPDIKIKQNDTNSHKFIFRVTENYAAYDLTGLMARAYFKKGDGTVVFQDCAIDSAAGGLLSALITTQCLTFAGFVSCELTIYGSAGELLTSASFNFRVLDLDRDDAAIASTSEFTSLTTLIVTAGQHETRITANEAQLAENAKQVRKRNYPGAISIVYDDGLSGDYIYAYPLHKQYNVPAMFAISAGKIGAANYMTVAQCQEINSGGLIGLADHEYNHTTMTGMTEQQIKDNLALTHTWFLTNIGKLPKVFVYPGGYKSNLIRNILYPLYRRARTTGEAGTIAIANRQKNTPWEFPWVGWDTAWFTGINDYINYCRKMVSQGLHIVCTFHNVGLTTAGSVISNADLETFLKFINDECIEVIRFDGIPQQHNLCKDGSLENMPTGAMLQNAFLANNGNISATWDKDAAGTSVVVDDTVARSGSKSLKFTRTYGDGQPVTYARTYVPSGNGDQMRFSFWHKSSDATGCTIQYTVEAYDEDGVQLGSANAYQWAAVETDWALWSYDMTAQAGAIWYTVRICQIEPAVGEVGARNIWVDDVCLNSINNKKYNEVRS